MTVMRKGHPTLAVGWGDTEVVSEGWTFKMPVAGETLNIFLLTEFLKWKLNSIEIKCHPVEGYKSLTNFGVFLVESLLINGRVPQNKFSSASFDRALVGRMPLNIPT